MKCLIFVILLVNFPVKGNSAHNGKPTEAEKDQFPFYAEIGHKTDNSWHPQCGGTLIDTKWILTAAYYFSKANSSGADQVLNFDAKHNTGMRLLASMGRDPNGGPGGKFIHIIKVYIHPYYTIKHTNQLSYGIIQENNVALAKLHHPFELSHGIYVIQIPKYQNKETRCQEGVLLGTENVNEHKVYARVTSKLKEDLKFFELSFESVFYTEVVRNGTTSMREDIGSPFLCYVEPVGTVVQYGILSVRIHSKEDGANIILGIYEKVDRHLDFITRLVPNVTIFQEDPHWILVKPPKLRLKSNSNNLGTHAFVLLGSVCCYIMQQINVNC